ncbi:MAG TPA: hypothetical protein VJ846_04610 [Sphingomicrobium sp.]|nr:hypothetical protein [Sphingomicrobium sp.]
MNSNIASELAQCLRHAVERVRIANAEGNPILSAWLSEADALLETLNNTTPTRPFAVISVSLDEGPSYPAYSRGAVWNGWQCPYFSFDEGMKLTAHPSLNGFKYDAEKDQFVFDDPEYADDPTYQADSFKPETITVDGQQIKVYAIGAFSWCWRKD